MPKKTPPPEEFSRRERQLMDIIYRKGRATAAEVRAEMPDPPSYSAARAMLRVLEEKGHLTHVSEGGRYVYSAAKARDEASRSALRRLLETFFDNSAERAVAALIDVSRDRLDEADFDRLAQLIENAKEDEK